jgi:hypothetical protein
MGEDEFWNSTPRYFEARQKAFFEAEKRAWERARYIGYLTVLPHVDNKKRRLKPTDLGRFEWESTKPVFEPINRAEMEQFAADAKRIIEQRLNITIGGDN